MNTRKILKQYLIIGGISFLALGALPVMAGIGLNTFSPGESISSSQVNENFNHLDGQIKNICQLPGQVIASGLVLLDGSMEDPFFLCEDISLSSEEDGTQVDFTLQGITIFNISIHAFPRSNTDRFCSVVVTGDSTFSVECFDGSEVPVENVFFLTLIRRS